MKRRKGEWHELPLALRAPVLLAIAAIAMKALPEPTEKVAKPKDVDTKRDER